MNNEDKYTFTQDELAALVTDVVQNVAPYTSKDTVISLLNQELDKRDKDIDFQYVICVVDDDMDRDAIGRITGGYEYGHAVTLDDALETAKSAAGRQFAEGREVFVAKHDDFYTHRPADFPILHYWKASGEEVSLTKMYGMVHSAEELDYMLHSSDSKDRKEAARSAYGLEELANDSDADVRAEVAKTACPTLCHSRGEKYDSYRPILEKLAHDTDLSVLKTVAESITIGSAKHFDAGNIKNNPIDFLPIDLNLCNAVVESAFMAYDSELNNQGDMYMARKLLNLTLSQIMEHDYEDNALFNKIYDKIQSTDELRDACINGCRNQNVPTESYYTPAMMTLVELTSDKGILLDIKKNAEYNKYDMGVLLDIKKNAEYNKYDMYDLFLRANARLKTLVTEDKTAGEFTYRG